VKGYTPDDKGKQEKICNKIIGKQVAPHHGSRAPLGVKNFESGAKAELSRGSEPAGSVLAAQLMHSNQTCCILPGTGTHQMLLTI
jgi:hypothetical protein